MTWLVAALLLLPPTAETCTPKQVDGYVATLRTAANALGTQGKPAEPEVAFFRALPSSFACFNAVFGYSTQEGPAPLYSEPQLHDLFPRLAMAVNKEEYVGKLVQLSVGARWEADQTGALQHAVRGSLESEPHLFLTRLAELDATSERSVWQFLFGGPHPSNLPLNDDLRADICSVSSRSCHFSASVYAQALIRERKEH